MRRAPADRGDGAIDGLAAIPVLRERVPECAIIALSGFGAERMEATVREAGASAYVEKGADVSVIRAAILAAGPRRCGLTGPHQSTTSGAWSLGLLPLR